MCHKYTKIMRKVYENEAIRPLTEFGKFSEIGKLTDTVNLPCPVIIPSGKFSGLGKFTENRLTEFR